MTPDRVRQILADLLLPPADRVGATLGDFRAVCEAYLGMAETVRIYDSAHRRGTDGSAPAAIAAAKRARRPTKTRRRRRWKV